MEKETSNHLSTCPSSEVSIMAFRSSYHVQAEDVKLAEGKSPGCVGRPSMSLPDSKPTRGSI